MTSYEGGDSLWLRVVVGFPISVPGKLRNALSWESIAFLLGRRAALLSAL